MGARKHEAVDLMKLFSMGSVNGWNEFLSECLRTHNINRLGKMRYAVQAGMVDLAKKKLNTPEIDVWFCRLTKSIENTAKAIIRQRHPMPGDNPMAAKKYPNALEAKRARDRDLAAFMKRSSY